MSQQVETTRDVMAGQVPAIPVFACSTKDVDARDDGEAAGEIERSMRHGRAHAPVSTVVEIKPIG
jgi:hypothetical protein